MRARVCLVLTHRVRSSFHCSSRCPLRLPVFLVSLVRPSAVTSTKELSRECRFGSFGDWGFADTTANTHTHKACIVVEEHICGCDKTSASSAAVLPFMATKDNKC